MCGRYRLSRRAEILASYFYAENEGMDWEARYNIAPTQTVPVIRQDPQEPIRRASLMRWGLVPNWAKDVTVGPRMINARAETAGGEAGLQRTPPTSALSHSSRRLLRMAEDWKEQTAVLLRDDGAGAFRLRWTLGQRANARRSYPRDVHNSDYDAQSAPRRHTRPDAGNPSLCGL